MSSLAPANLKRRELGALRVHPENRARFKLNSKRAHPPIPPRGRALTLRPRELEARARFRFALEVRHGSSPGMERRLGTREQHPRETEFVARRSGGFWAVSLSDGCPIPVRNLSESAVGPGATSLPPVVVYRGSTNQTKPRAGRHTCERGQPRAKRGRPAARLREGGSHAD